MPRANVTHFIGALMLHALGMAYCMAAELPVEIATALQQNAQSWDGVEVSGTRKRRLLMRARAGLHAIGTLETTKEFTRTIRFAVRIRGSQVHESFRYPAGPYNTGTAINEYAFDGQKFYGGVEDPRSNRGMPAQLAIKSPAILQKRAGGRLTKVFSLWYLEASGFSGPCQPWELGQPVASAVLKDTKLGELISYSDQNEKVDRLVEIVVRYPDPWVIPVAVPDAVFDAATPESNDLQKRIAKELYENRGTQRECRFVLDPALHYAVREMVESRVPDKVMFHTTNEDFFQVPGTALWIPQHSETVSFAYETQPRDVSEEPVYATIIDVNKIEKRQLTDRDFQVWYDYPGTVISDYLHPQARADHAYTYRVPITPEGLKKLGKAMERKTSIWNWLLWGNVIGFVLIVAALIWRRKRRKRATPAGEAP